jgi:hypothetical protein
VGETLVAIHQPNFLPWLGYFDKLAQADVFVVLDDAQYPKKSGTWMNRTQLLVGGKPSWVTAPVDRSYHGVRTIAEMRLDESRDWRAKLTRTIQQSYARAPWFDSIMPVVGELIERPTSELLDYNERGVHAIAELIGLDPSKFVRASTLGVTSTATDRLIDLTKAVGGEAYLAGGGAGGYQEDEKFAAAGIELQAQAFAPPVYSQLSDEHEPGLSIVDALMNCGPEDTRALIGGNAS